MQITKDNDYIVASSLVNLFSDVLNTIEFTIAPLNSGVSEGPLSGTWKQLFDPLISLREQKLFSKNGSANFQKGNRFSKQLFGKLSAT
ncbi:MAG: hypothetical protein WDM76_17455 [Limisphaerales bacterium]